MMSALLSILSSTVQFTILTYLFSWCSGTVASSVIVTVACRFWFRRQYRESLQVPEESGMLKQGASPFEIPLLYQYFESKGTKLIWKRRASLQRGSHSRTLSFGVKWLLCVDQVEALERNRPEYERPGHSSLQGSLEAVWHGEIKVLVLLLGVRPGNGLGVIRWLVLRALTLLLALAFAGLLGSLRCQLPLLLAPLESTSSVRELLLLLSVLVCGSRIQVS